MVKVGRTIAQLPFMTWKKELGEVLDGNLWLKCFNSILRVSANDILFILLAVK